jgi:BirA family biotin operon repressor/biotin-[acetyl-CoA-carboxylase] ligase
MNEATARVLSALHEAGDEPCSGADLSSALGVSRAQIWKHVGVLRERGYRIEGTPGGGYRLTEVPDRLLAEEIGRGLGTRWLGRRLHAFDEIDSTNRVALEMALGGAPHGTTVIAEAQTAGRGRLGRAFHSPPRCNLYASIVLRPEMDTAAAPTLLLAAGVAVAEAVVATLGTRDDVEIKWPNDVLIGGRKTSGILMELGTEEARVRHAVLGIGVNLNVDPATFPAAFRERATSLSARAGRAIDRIAFTRRLFRILEEVLDEHAAGGLAAIRPRFDAFFHMEGRRVTVHEVGGGVLEGEVLGLAGSGALRVEGADGRVTTVLAGDVTLSPPGAPQEEIHP